MALSSDEARQLAALMAKAEFPLPEEVFLAWCQFFLIVAAELAVVRETENGSALLLTYRNDVLFHGWHIPGSVVRPGEGTTGALARVVATEVHANVTQPEFFTWADRMYGSEDGECSRGNEVALLFMARLAGDFVESDTARFFPLREIPTNLLPLHVPFVAQIKGNLGIA